MRTQDSAPAPDPPTDRRRRRRAFSLSLKLGGIEVTTQGWRGVVTLGALVVVAAAIGKELCLPAAERTWHGHVFRYVPYDFRRPTLRHIRTALWDPSNPRLFTDRVVGIGWSINLARLRSALKS